MAVIVEEEPVETENEQQQDEQSVPEIPVIRSNTPRPFSFDGLVAQHGKDGWQHNTAQMIGEVLSAFPQEAPLAPPVPEEVDEQGDEVQTAPIKELSEATPLPLPPTTVNADAAEFVWLFEYGLEMDDAVLNSPDHLHNLALLYGPAVLKGYELAFAVVESLQQKVVATVTPLATPGAEVWGILYRIPRRLLEQENDESSELDRIHAAVPPASVFERVEVVVSEAYRGRELPCITYIARRDQHNHHTRYIQQQPASQISDAAYLQHLLEVARKQALPADYIRALELTIVSNATANRTPVPTTEQNTEPLPVLAEQQDSSRPASSAEPIQPIETIQRTQSSQSVSLSHSRNVGLVLFACYLGVLLLLALALAVMQGVGIFATIFTASFMPLNVPWYVLLYGLIGGNISCLVTLGRGYGQYRQQRQYGRHGQVIAGLPDFVIAVWCIRPFVGIVQAMLVYLLFNAGLFVLSGNAEQHMMLFSLLAAVAGFGERLLFMKRVA